MIFSSRVSSDVSRITFTTVFLPTRLHHAADVLLRRVRSPCDFEGADVDHHVDFLGALLDGAARLERLDVGQVSAERKPDHGAHLHAASLAAARGTAEPSSGFTHTDAKQNCAASRHSCSTSSRDASGFSSVWSMSDASPS